MQISDLQETMQTSGDGILYRIHMIATKLPNPAEWYFKRQETRASYLPLGKHPNKGDSFVQVND